VAPATCAGTRTKLTPRLVTRNLGSLEPEAAEKQFLYWAVNYTICLTSYLNGTCLNLQAVFIASALARLTGDHIEVLLSEDNPLLRHHLSTRSTGGCIFWTHWKTPKNALYQVKEFNHDLAA